MADVNQGRATHKEWYLIFEEGREAGWWKIFCPKNFSHVRAFTQYKSRIIAVDQTIDSLEITEYNISVEKLLEAYISLGTNILKTTVPVHKNSSPWFGMYCVSAVKSLLSMPRTPFILTPKHLHDYLLAKGWAEKVE